MTQENNDTQSIHQLAPLGHIRLAANMANARLIRLNDGGDYEGPLVSLAQDLQAILGLAAVIVPYASGGKVLADMEGWDLATLAFDGSRQQLRYLHEVAKVSATFVASHRTMQEKQLTVCSDADRDDLRIGVAHGAAYESYLRGHFHSAKIVTYDTPAEALKGLETETCDIAAGLRLSLRDYVAAHQNMGLMSDDYVELTQCLAIAATKQAAGDYLLQRLKSANFGRYY